MSEVTKDRAGVVVPPPLIFSVLLGLGFLAHWIHPLHFLPACGTLNRILGNMCFLISGAIAVPAIVIMRRNNTSLVPHGTTTKIVTSGPFRFSRNPLYVSLLFIHAGITSYANALWLLLLLPALAFALDRLAIRHEEAYLEEKFGEEYLQYKHRTRRWV